MRQFASIVVGILVVLFRAALSTPTDGTGRMLSAVRHRLAARTCVRALPDAPDGCGAAAAPRADRERYIPSVEGGTN